MVKQSVPQKAQAAERAEAVANAEAVAQQLLAEEEQVAAKAAAKLNKKQKQKAKKQRQQQEQRQEQQQEQQQASLSISETEASPLPSSHTHQQSSLGALTQEASQGSDTIADGLEASARDSDACALHSRLPAPDSSPNPASATAASDLQQMVPHSALDGSLHTSEERLHQLDLGDTGASSSTQDADAQLAQLLSCPITKVSNVRPASDAICKLTSRLILRATVAVHLVRLCRHTGTSCMALSVCSKSMKARQVMCPVQPRITLSCC